MANQRHRPEQGVLYRTVQSELETFLECAADCDRLIPRFVECERRGFCPSCGGRRMAYAAAHLVDRVLPEVPRAFIAVVFPLEFKRSTQHIRQVSLLDNGTPTSFEDVG